MTVSALETYAANAANFRPVPGLVQRLHQAMVVGYAARASAEVERLNEEITRMSSVPGASTDRIIEKLSTQRDQARIRASMAY